MISVEITRSGLAAIGRRGFQAVGKAAMLAAAEHWYKVYLPLHFMNTAYRRYRYKPRDERTRELKLQRKEWPFGENRARAIGEDKPHVFSGRSRENALSKKNIETKAPNYQSYYALVKVDVRVYNFSSGKRIDLRDELTRYTPQEERYMEKLFAEEWERQLIKRGAMAPKKTKRIAA